MNESDDRQPARRLLLLAADWQTRALTLGELQTRGYDVMALPGLTWGIKAIVQRKVDPLVILLDTKGDADVTPERVRHIRDMAPDAPLVLIVSAYDRSNYAPLRDELAALLVRPVTVGEIVRTVEHRLGE